MQNVLTTYYRCVPDAAPINVRGEISKDAGYFGFGPDVVCYGRSATGFRSNKPDGPLYDVFADVTHNGSGVQLPFNPSEIVTNFHYERYARNSTAEGGMDELVRKAYYFVRPMLPVGIRKHLQKARLNGWRNLSFPRWPVDTTVDTMMQRLMASVIRGRNNVPVPFIWFWPEGKDGCAVLTHDVETQAGVNFSSVLMDMDESFRMPASFQVVPEKRYPVTQAYLNSIRARGFEVNVQDLNHDGHLYRDKRTFERRVTKINQYARRFDAAGFRAGVLYRNQEWFKLLNFDYDSSVPNVAHLDPQRGGCCTVMPYFVGNLVELPVTMTQDYSLFHILNDYSQELWEQEVRIILQAHGLINIIAHPDYLDGAREREAYLGLLQLLDRVRSENNVWISLPRDVATWWRQRSQMQLVKTNGEWCVEGPGSERAIVAYAKLEGDAVSYQKGSAAFEKLRPARA